MPPSSAKPKQVLFIDDDPVLLEMVQQLMGHFAGGSWDISVAADVAPALSILQEHAIDLVVVDVHMPVVDGIQFLKLLQRKFPGVLKVVLTGDSTGAYRAACLNLGVELYLEKPREQNGWRAIYATLDELIKLKPQEQGFRGVLQKVGLSDVLQLECLACNSSILELTAGQERGLIYIREGQIVHARIGQRTGREAFFFLYTLSGGEFSLKPYAEPPQVDIVDCSWESLIMEASQLRDEAPPPAPAPGQDTIIEFATDGIVSTIPGVEVADAKRAARADSPELMRPQVNEVLISSRQGDVLYELHCSKANARISLLDFIIQKSGQMSRALPLGEFDRLEAIGLDSRMIAHVQPEHAIFVVTSLVPAVEAAAQDSGK